MNTTNQRRLIPAASLVAPPSVAVAAVLALSAVSWVFAVRQMSGMDMGVGTQLGSFPSFLGVWVLMMAAMMLPSAAPALLRRGQTTGVAASLPLFVMSYLTVWAIAGALLYALYRPHGPTSAGVAAIAAGVYELVPLKRRFRRRCRETVSTGFEFGLNCVGSTIGLMLMMAALGVMSVAWMGAIAVLVLGQKATPAKAAIDLPLALTIIGLGVLILVQPSAVPGLIPSM